MKQRTITAVVFAIAMLGGVFGGATAFFILFALITAGSLWELMGLLFAAEGNHLRLRKVLGTVLGVSPYLIFGSAALGLIRTDSGTFLAWNTAFLILLLALLALVFLLFVLELFLHSEQPFANIGNYLLGLVYVGLPFALLASLSTGPDGGYAPLRVFGLLLLTWTNDTMAYLVGSRIGKRPFFSRISPKKTWEGTLGGIAFTFFAGWLLAQWIGDFTFPEWMLLAGCVAVFGTLGDLVESMLKRSIHIKDSGSLLPGHGGLLDRFDSFIFVLPFAWLALMIFEG
ncbi:MAG: phosphatidate cytidylyltransferase [Saprospiraceae bacterium]|jgi:phosphatidate cytidylyltransferase|nr:phosphatidate cytidylyltransferase [Saprospiraceae bacterium]